MWNSHLVSQAPRGFKSLFSAIGWFLAILGVIALVQMLLFGYVIPYFEPKEAPVAAQAAVPGENRYISFPDCRFIWVGGCQYLWCVDFHRAGMSLVTEHCVPRDCVVTDHK